MYNSIFSNNVLRILNERKLTKQELSRRSGVSISFISDLTNGKANPSLKVMEAIAEALELPLPCLLISFEPSEEHAELDNLPPENEYVPKRKANIVKKWDKEKKEN